MYQWPFTVRGIKHTVAFMELLFGGVLGRHPDLCFSKPVVDVGAPNFVVAPC